MAGHSEWSKVKPIKGVLDRKRGKRISNFEQENSAAVYLRGGVEPKLDPSMGDSALGAPALSTMKIQHASAPAMRIEGVLHRVLSAKRACQISIPSQSVDSDTVSEQPFQAVGVKSRCEHHFAQAAHDQLIAEGETIESIGTSPASQNIRFITDSRALVADYNAGWR
jgi:hypothetical protein